MQLQLDILMLPNQLARFSLQHDLLTLTVVLCNKIDSEQLMMSVYTGTCAQIFVKIVYLPIVLLSLLCT